MEQSSRDLDVIAVDICANFKDSVENRIALGKLMNEAHKHFPDDKSFGKWWSAKFADQISKRTAYNCMRLAMCFGESFDENIPLSGLYLLAAPENDDIRADALDMLVDNLKVSLQDVKSAIATAKSNAAPAADITLDDVLSTVDTMPEDELRQVFMQIIERPDVNIIAWWMRQVEKST